MDTNTIIVARDPQRFKLRYPALGETLLRKRGAWLAVVSLRNVLNLDTSVGEVGLVILQYLY